METLYSLVSFMKTISKQGYKKKKGYKLLMKKEKLNFRCLYLQRMVKQDIGRL